MSPIIPAVIPESLNDIASVISLIAPFSHEIQIDIVDGVFVPYCSWPYLKEMGTIRDLKSYIDGFQVEMDLMIMEPELVAREYIEAGARKIVVHLESVRDMDAIRALKKTHDCKLGFSIGNDTPLHVLTDVIADADYVQLMGIAHIGVQGQPFDNRVLERITTLRQMYPTLLISIDGSVNRETVGSLAHAGANRCIAGSSIVKSTHPQEAYKELTALFSIAT